MLNISKVKGNKIITVSNYKKIQIHNLAHISLDRIEVKGNGWEHVRDISPNNSIFDKYSKE